MGIASFKFYVGGVLTDPSSAVLADPTNAFGVRRADTGAIVVPSGTSLVKQATGIYAYSFADPAPNLTYEYWITTVYNAATFYKQKFSYGAGTTTNAVGTMYLSDARKMARIYARNAGDQTYYPTFMLDFAIQRAANELIREAALCLRTDQVATVAGQSTYSTPAGFRADRADTVYLSGPNVTLQGAYCGVDPCGLYTRGAPVDQDYVSGQATTVHLTLVQDTAVDDLSIANPLQAQPQVVALQSDGTFIVYPTPDQVYTVNFRWMDFFTKWHLGIPLTSFTNTAGVLSSVVVIDGSDNQGAALAASFIDLAGTGSGATATAVLTNAALTGVTVGGSGGSGYITPQLLLGGYNSADTTFNVPDDLMAEVLSLGVPAFLQYNQPEQEFAKPAKEAWDAYVAKVRGKIGGLGAQRVIRRRR